MTRVINDRGPLRERKKLATRARILDVAIRMFAERGVEAPTVEEIAAAAEVGKGTIYNYFQTKEEILVAFMVDVERRVQEQARTFSRARGPLESILTSYIRYHLKLKEPYRSFIPVLLGQFFARGAALYPHVVETQKVIDPPLREFFQHLQQRGLVRRDVDLRDLLEIFKMLHFGIVMIWLNDQRPYRATFRLLREEMRLFCHGLAPSKAKSS